MSDNSPRVIDKPEPTRAALAKRFTDTIADALTSPHCCASYYATYTGAFGIPGVDFNFPEGCKGCDPLRGLRRTDENDPQGEYVPCHLYEARGLEPKGQGVGEQIHVPPSIPGD